MGESVLSLLFPHSRQKGVFFLFFECPFWTRVRASFLLERVSPYELIKKKDRTPIFNKEKKLRKRKSLSTSRRIFFLSSSSHPLNFKRSSYNAHVFHPQQKHTNTTMAVTVNALFKKSAPAPAKTVKKTVRDVD